MEKWLSKKNVRLSLYFFMPVFFASFAIGLGLTIIEAMDRLLPAGTILSSHRQDIEYLRWYVKVATLGGAAIAVITGLLIAFALNRPLKRLEDTLKKIAAGNIEELNLDITNEFVSLSKTFNTAISTIKQRLLTAKDSASDEAVHGLERLERLAVLGGISAIIAHEIKNPLASIKGLTQLMAEKAGMDSDAIKYISVMLEEIDRLNKVADNLLYLAKPSKEDYRYCDIRQLLDKVAAKALHAIDKKVEILKDSDKAPVEIWMDSDRLERAFLNLMINALQSTLENKGQDSGGAVAITVAKYGDTVFVKITNKGSFIPAQGREQIFEPFYTTKGRGTGLGLAVAKHIISSHGGDIRVESNEEETTFIVELPLTSPSLDGRGQGEGFHRA
ncbi:MAG: ATP-binding protein [Deltaproteobacteria bacterium]|nr:ATP-binding protein [Deltaproteobacteria bacterium]